MIINGKEYRKSERFSGNSFDVHSERGWVYFITLREGATLEDHFASQRVCDYWEPPGSYSGS